jgi:hypothetical protein
MAPLESNVHRLRVYLFAGSKTESSRRLYNLNNLLPSNCNSQAPLHAQLVLIRRVHHELTSGTTKSVGDNSAP